MELPNRDSPHLHLVVATQEELLAQQHHNSSEWRDALTLDAYLRREEYLIRQNLTKDGGLTPWMLVYEPPEGGPRQVVCGCESIKKKALHAKEGRVTDVVAHGVASVFCSPAYRGKGYAGRMISEVGKRLKTWQIGQSEHATFSVLYSDIGKTFYAAHGWKPFPSSHIALPPKSTEEQDRASVNLIQDHDVAERCSVDEKLMRQRLAESTSASPRTAVALIPDLATLQWHAAREDFVHHELHPNQSALQSRGAMTDLAQGAQRVWCLWTHVWTQGDAPNILYILRIVAEDEGHSEMVQSIARLLVAAQNEAKAFGMDVVQMWNPSEATVAAARSIMPEVEVVQREKDSITSLRWYGEGSEEDVDWLCNEKYGWC
ncbi:hypothetical protein LTR56_008607 [Elasticomyces elasticus]|nr:hypothetical protein LTR56_008607 [Elasticomyces elasticus]KAK3662213.1 hypothetical protein LTR22_006978 [Elasticomyces elasticus]KAK4916191.1 hypothetical protein LTR49_015832 [Elasticomyces elasticus]KAK5767976.1 hypothetical protein LTS12_001793 [Elasticomyces elasticus]